MLKCEYTEILKGSLQSMRKKAFTLAETLATLGVIGIVAALMIPSVVANYNNHIFKTSKETFRATLSDSVRIMAATESKLNKAKNYTDEDNEENNRSANEVFVEDHFSNYIKFAKICDPEQAGGIYNCGWINDKVYKSMNSDDKLNIPTKNSDVGFDSDEKLWSAITVNGMSLLIAYNPDCKSFNNAENGAEENKQDETDKGFHPKETACINIIYDINGVAKPNTFGKDVGIATVYYPRTARVGVPIFTNNAEYVTGISSFESAEEYCNNLSYKKKATLPTLEEAGSIYLNSKPLLNSDSHEKVWFSSAKEEKSAGYTAGSVICVNR